MKDVAAASGVSKFTVSLALRGSARIPAATRAKVRAAARRLGYRPSALLSSVMSAVRGKDRSKACETIAVVYTRNDIFELKPTFPSIILGIRHEAARLGFNIAEFFIDSPFLTPEKFARILSARGIRGGIITGLLEKNRLPKKFSAVWKKFKFVSAGLRMLEPAIDFAITDQYLIAYRATLKMIEYGYARPALVVNGAIDALIDGRFAAGFLRAQLEIPETRRVPPFMDATLNPAQCIEPFRKWFSKYRPDAVLCLYDSTRELLKSVGARVPRDVAIAHLERVGSEFAGMDQNNAEVGRAAVARLSDILNNPRGGGFSAPVCTVVAPRWKSCPTMPRKRRA